MTATPSDPSAPDPQSETDSAPTDPQSEAEPDQDGPTTAAHTPESVSSDAPKVASPTATPVEPAARTDAPPSAPSKDDQADQASPTNATTGEPDAASADEQAPQKAAEKAPKKKKPKKKPSGPDPKAVIKTIGTTSEAALAYVQNPDPQLSRMARKHREVIITDVPPVTAGALLGPDALCRHFLASAATGRYRDLFHLWELFTLFPAECKAVLAQRQIAQEKAKAKLRTATHLGLLGDATRVADDIDAAAGLPWRWLKEILEPMGPAIRQRPLVMAAMVRRVPDYQMDVPDDPSDRWLAEAAEMKNGTKPIPDEIDRLLGEHADRLPATVATLAMAYEQYADRVPALIDRVDLHAPDIGAILAWARDHGHGDRLLTRVSDSVEAAAQRDRAAGLSAWKQWRDRGVDVTLPTSVAAPNLDGLDLGQPETAELIKILIEGGAELNAQDILDEIAKDNRMRGEKAFEAFVCAGFDDVHLPLALEGNPMVRSETRCPSCQAWTWVRPGLEKRCPRTGCPLRASTGSEEDAGAAVDAAVAALLDEDDSTVGSKAQDPSSAGSSPSIEAPAAPRPNTAPPDSPG